MMAVLSLAFFGCFIAAHMVRGGWEALPLELCFFREGASEPLGYALFVLLFAIGALLVWRMARDPACEADFRLCVPMLGLLIFVAVTPSMDGFHLIASLIVIGGLYAYYTRALECREHPWLRLHLLMPLLMLAIPPLGSFGSWQKGMILYIVVLINAQYLALGPAPRKQSKIKLEVKRPWKRRRIARTANSVFMRDRLA